MAEPARVHLVTVGTSLLTNAARGRSGQPDLNGLVRYLAETEPKLASAETNTLSRRLQPGDRLVLFPSDTEDGRLCAAALAQHYRHAGHDVAEEPVPGLTYEVRRFASDGLRGLAALLVRYADEARRRGDEVLVCATGGFKAETALATLVGLVFGVPVYYIHERFDEVVSIPALPVSWDFALAHEHRDVLEWLMDPRAEAEVEQRLKGRPGAIRELLEPTEGGLCLSAAGFVLLAAAWDRDEARPRADIRLSPRARAVYVREPARFDGLLEKLGSPELRDGQAERLRGRGGYVYPRGGVAERVIYDLDGHTVYVCELLRGHARGTKEGERYYVLRQQGVRFTDYDGFEPWPLRETPVEATAEPEEIAGLEVVDESTDAASPASPEAGTPTRAQEDAEPVAAPEEPSAVPESGRAEPAEVSSREVRPSGEGSPVKVLLEKLLERLRGRR